MNDEERSNYFHLDQLSASNCYEKALDPNNRSCFEKCRKDDKWGGFS